MYGFEMLNTLAPKVIADQNKLVSIKKVFR